MKHKEISIGVIPPKQNAAFVADMERVLALYAKAYDPKRPIVCLSGVRPCALVGEERKPLPMRPGVELRQDHEYTRGGLCCLLMAFEPLRSWRRVWVRPKRRRLEFAEVARELAEKVYPEAERIRLVCDQLNTHTPAAFYERYAPEEAQRLAERIEFVYTPVHGSWLNVVEAELSAFVRQCLGHRRLGRIEKLREEAEAWTEARNEIGATVEWHMTTDDARSKLRRLYPSL